MTATTATARTGTGAAAGTVRLTIDWTACDGAGLCTELLPEVLTSDPWGFPLARDHGVADRQGAVAVPEHLTPGARRAVAACPRLALRLQPSP